MYVNACVLYTADTMKLDARGMVLDTIIIIIIFELGHGRVAVRARTTATRYGSCRPGRTGRTPKSHHP